MGAVGLHAQAGQARASWPRRFEQLGNAARRSGCGACSSWRTTRSSSTACGSCSARTTWRPSARATAAECLEQLAGRHVRLHGARPQPARRLRLRAAGDAQPRGRATPSRRSSSTPAATCRPTRSSGCGATRKSIIIKGAKSPERLLDEVTLFLHQVVSELPPEQQRMLEKARSRDAALEGRRILVAEDDVRNVFALTSILEPRGRASCRSPATAARRWTRWSVAAATRRADRPRAHGHHDARDGRPHRHARDPQAARVEEAADHRAHGQGHEGRPGAVPGRRRQRLHGQAARRGEAALARPRLDARDDRDHAPPTRPRTSSCGLLLEAIYRKYHYDFRGVLARRRSSGGCAQAREHFGCAASPQLQDRVLHDAGRAAASCSATSPCR